MGSKYSGSNLQGERSYQERAMKLLEHGMNVEERVLKWTLYNSYC